MHGNHNKNKKQTVTTRRQNGDRGSSQSTSGSVSDANPVVPWSCGTCEVDFTSENDKMALCDFCLGKFCTPCINMSDDQYSALQILERDDCFWLCPDCVFQMHKFKKMKHESDVLNKIKADIEGRLSSIEVKVDTLKENIKTEKSQTMTDIKKTFAQVLVGEKNVDEGLENRVQEIGASGLFKNICVEQKQEALDKEERDKNIILFKCTEKAHDDKEEAKKEDEVKTQKFLAAIERSDIEIKSMFRLGNFSEENNKKGVFRPLKVMFYNKTDRDSVMRNLFKLKHNKDEDVDKIQVGYDMTKEERAKVKEKVAEAIAKGTDEVFYSVRGPPWALHLVQKKRRPGTNQATPVQT